MFSLVEAFFDENVKVFCGFCYIFFYDFVESVNYFEFVGCLLMFEFVCFFYDF